MILRNHLQLGLPRRVVVYYLFFCMAAVCWLAVGVVVTTQVVVSARSENAVLSRIGRSAAAMEIDYIRHGPENLQDSVSQLRSEGRLAYCAIVNSDGKYLAHTSERLIGKSAVDTGGTLASWGDVEGVSFVDEHGRNMREYRVPLQVDRQQIGVLRAGAIEPGWWGTLCEAADVAPLAVLVPLLLVGAGAVVLSRQAGPLAAMEVELRRLARVPLGQPIEPQQQVARSATALGWNRVVEEFDRLRASDELGSVESRLNQSGAASSHDDIWKLLPDGVAITDVPGNIQQANRATAALLGHGGDPESLIRKSMIEQLATQLAQHETDELALLKDQSSWQRSVVCEFGVSQNETEHVLRIARQPLRGEQNDLRGHLWTIRDVSQQKLAEQMRDQFIDAATHELRTPLANIKAYAETLAAMDETDLESQKEFCNTINSEATRLARFVDDLLSISSMEVGSMTIEKQSVNTERMMDEVVQKVRPLAGQNDLELDVQLPGKLPALSVDKDKFVAMLVNLLGNAVKYTPQGGRVGLKVKVSDSDLQIDIEDTGFGIAPEEVPRVFDKFFRSADPRVVEQTGTGLGLSLAREVVRLHGGDISVQSEVDKGSTFTVTLPLESR